MQIMAERIRSFVLLRPRVILGSSSSSRKAIMDELRQEHGLPAYEVITANIDEKAIRHDAPEQLVMALGRAKRDAILAKMKTSPQDHQQDQGLLITCDQVVVHDNRILEKPESEEECRAFIRGYRPGYPCSTVGSVVVTNLASGKSYEAIDTSRVHFKAIPEETIDALIADGQCMWCAGGLMVEHPLVVPFVEKIDGTEDGVKGLSKKMVIELLLEAADSC
jgi:septum formation protein